MNTFVCEPTFAASARSLDWRRLGRQRGEVWQMLQALLGVSAGWSRHPAVQAWRGREKALAEFGLACHDEWLARGYRDTTRPRLAELAASLPDTGAPWWVGDPAYLAHVRGILVSKDPAWYGPRWPGVEAVTGGQWWPAPEEAA